ncbi:MAG: hypothetical protein Q7W30_10840 [Coriobacteriia bacterium]|nr:hypothetical protein [Coriobacteriia bacterium]
MLAAGGIRRLAPFMLLALCVVAAAHMAVPATARADRTLGISTPKFEFSAAPGATGKGDLYVVNDGSEPLKVMVYMADQSVDATGGTAYTVPKVGDADFMTSPALWFRIQVPEKTQSIGNIPFLEIGPGGRVPVKFNFQVPEGVAPGDKNVVLFFEMFELKGSQGAQSQIMGRLGSRIRMRIQGTLVEKVEVEPFSVRNWVIGDLMPYEFAIRNSGNIDESVAGELVLRDGNDTTLDASRVMTETAVYASSMTERTGTMKLEKATLGAFTARLTVTYPRGGGVGEPVTIVKDRTVYVIPLWLAIFAAVVLGVLALYAAWRAAVRAAAGEAGRSRSRAAREADRRLASRSKAESDADDAPSDRD